MSTSKTVAGCAVLFALLAVGTAIHEVRASRQAAGSLAAARAEHDRLMARLRGLEARAMAAEQENATRQASLEAARTARAAASARAAVTPPSVSVNPADLAAKHPEVRQTWTTYSRARIANEFRPLFRELRLTPEQIDEFTRLMVQGEVMSNWTGPDGKPVTLSVGGDRDKAQDRLRVLLGEEGYRRYVEFGGQVRSWRLVADLAGNLYSTSEPLMLGQSEQLVRIFVDHGVISGRAEPPDWPAVIGAAQAILTSAQLTALDAFQAQEEYGQAYVGAMRQAMKGSAPGIPAK